jgi:isopenicillin-N epimerase
VESGRAWLAGALGTEAQVPESSFGSMAVVALPAGVGATVEEARVLQADLYDTDRIEVPIGSWNERGYVRLSAQAYNAPGEYERLARALPALSLKPAAHQVGSTA